MTDTQKLTDAVEGDSVHRLVYLLQCGRAKCGHVLTKDEYDWRPSGIGKTAICPMCGCSEFYSLKANGAKKAMKTQTNSTAPEGCVARLVSGSSFWDKLLRKWDWWIYRKACGSLRRMTLDNPAMSYLMELNIRGWNEQLEISPELRRSTELFHEAMRDHSQHNAESIRAEIKS